MGYVTMNKGYEYRLYPNAEQAEKFAKTFGCVRFVWNQMLDAKMKDYENTQGKLAVTPAQYKGQYEWLKEVDSLALANAQLNLNKAYAEFNKQPEFKHSKKKIAKAEKRGIDLTFYDLDKHPKFKAKKSSKQSYTTNNQNGTIEIIKGEVKLPKIGMVKMKQHRAIGIDERIKRATITRRPSGKYYISIMVEYEQYIPTASLDKSKSVGLDYASSGFYVDSQNAEANYPRYYRKAQAKLEREQRKLAKMAHGSANYEKQRVKVAKIHEKVANQRRDWQHKESAKLADEYDYIFVEDINLRAMAQGLRLGKSTNDNGFGQFRAMCEYKMAKKGKVFRRIDRQFPSSKMCRFCGALNRELTLSDRVWACACGAILNRDENAAINILNEGLRQIG
jgi:putative transposase